MISYLPARSFRKNDVIRMFVLRSFNKTNACEVFPMSHGLFKKSFVSSAEVPVYFVRYNAIIPNSLFSCCRCSCRSPLRLILIVDMNYKSDFNIIVLELLNFTLCFAGDCVVSGDRAEKLPYLFFENLIKKLT